MKAIFVSTFVETNFMCTNSPVSLRFFASPRRLKVKRDGKWGNIDSSELVPGDLVMLSSGAAVLADCVVRTKPKILPSESKTDHRRLSGQDNNPSTIVNKNTPENIRPETDSFPTPTAVSCSVLARKWLKSYREHSRGFWCTRSPYWLDSTASAICTSLSTNATVDDMQRV